RAPRVPALPRVPGAGWSSGGCAVLRAAITTAGRYGTGARRLVARSSRGSPLRPGRVGRVGRPGASRQTIARTALGIRAARQTVSVSR
ncbi:MAG: hypothetical protein ACREXR_06830, partial [Gammaproteobacteria bacterium]